MKFQITRNNVLHLFYIIPAFICFFLVIANAAFCGDFSATFNYRLENIGSSWHEAKIISVKDGYFKAEITSDLLRHIPFKKFKVRCSKNSYKVGDFVLLNCFTDKTKKTEIPRHLTNVINVGKIDRKQKKLVEHYNESSYQQTESHSIVGWFYNTGNWNARIVFEKNRFYAKLPDGKKYLIFDPEIFRKKQQGKKLSTVFGLFPIIPSQQSLES